MDARPRRGGLVGPVILIGLGLLFLLSNLGLLSWSVWQVILRLWPVLLIAVGLDLLIGRRSAWLSLLVVVLALAVAGAAVWYLAPASAGGEGGAERETVSQALDGATRADTVSQALDGATRADVEISAGVATLHLSATPEAVGLMEGTVDVNPGERLLRDFQVRGDTAVLRVRSRAESGPWFLGNRWGGDRVWDLKLSPAVPMRLKVNGGVGQANLDLSRLQVTDLDVNTGVGRVTLTLPARGQVRANVDGGVGELNVVVPEGMAARIRVESGIGDVQVSGNYSRQDRTYTSPGYDTAQNRVELRIHGGVGRISLR